MDNWDTFERISANAGPGVVDGVYDFYVMACRRADRMQRQGESGHDGALRNARIEGMREIMRELGFRPEELIVP